MRPYSPDWFAAAHAAVSSLAPDDDLDITVDQHIRTPDGEISYQLFARGGRCGLRVDPAEAGQVSFRTDLATATALADGTAVAADAVLNGTLELTGDPTVLVEGAEFIAAAGGAIASVPRTP